MSASFARPVKRYAFRLQRAEYNGFQRTSRQWRSVEIAERFPPRQDLPRTTPSQDREVQRAEGTEKPFHRPACALTIGHAQGMPRSRAPRGNWAVAPPFPEHCADISHQAVNKLPLPLGRTKKETSSELGLGCGGSRATSEIRVASLLSRAGETRAAHSTPT